MTYGGWITFILSVGSFTALFGWGLYNVLTSKPPVADAEIADNPRTVGEKPQKRAKNKKNFIRKSSRPKSCR